MQPIRVYTGRPATSEYAPFYEGYISLVPDGDIIKNLAAQCADTVALLTPLDEEQAGKAYAPGKWSIKEVVGHINDAERIFAYRMLRIARNDQTPLAGFEERPYVEQGQFGRYSLASLLEEFQAVRKTTILMLEKFGPEVWTRSGIVSGKTATVRAFAFVTAGHELHHRNILRERYLPVL